MLLLKVQKDSKEIVFPGSFLATAEEYVPGENTYESDKGTIHANGVGIKQIDSAKHEVSLQKLSKLVKPLDRDSIVIAKVTMTKDNMALVEILSSEKNGEPRKPLNTYAAIPAFNATGSFVKSMKELFKIGDIVKAKVTMSMPQAVDLATKWPEFGVIKAFCTKCRQPLHLFGETLKCGSCGHTERRKLSKDYLLQ